MSMVKDGCTSKKKQDWRIVRTLIYALLFGISIMLLWSIWTVFLQHSIPRHRSWNYKTVTEASSNDYIPKEIPATASEIKCYWGVRWFIKVNGYGATLPHMDYEKYKKDILQKYKGRYDGFKDIRETLIVFGDDARQDYLHPDFFEEYDIGELKSLLTSDEKVEDYSIVALYDSYGGKVTYFECVICNDKTSRIIELSRMNRNAQK